MKLYMFQTVRLSIIRSLFTVYSAMVYVIQVCRQLSSRSMCWHIPLLSVQWINSWWWTDELSETCRVSWQNKFLKLVHLVGFITKKFATLHGHMNVKKEGIHVEHTNLGIGISYSCRTVRSAWIRATATDEFSRKCICGFFYKNLHRYRDFVKIGQK